jgi:hypothetical protein
MLVPVGTFTQIDLYSQLFRPLFRQNCHPDSQFVSQLFPNMPKLSARLPYSQKLGCCGVRPAMYNVQPPKKM